MSGIGHFEICGEASVARVRVAGLIDAAATALATMVVMPQPIVRAAVMQGRVTPAGIVAFVGVMLAAVLAVFWLYLVFAALTWGRSLGMFLLDLALATETRPTMREATFWALGWCAALLPAIVGWKRAYDPDSGWPARWSKAPTKASKSLDGA